MDDIRYCPIIRSNVGLNTDNFRYCTKIKSKINLNPGYIELYSIKFKSVTVPSDQTLNLIWIMLYTVPI